MRRRVIFTLAAMLCALPHADPARTSQPESKPPLTPRHSKAPAAGIMVPFEYFRRHIYVTVSLQGKPGFAFMLDSGANRNILNLRTSKLLGMQPLKLQQEKNVGFGDAPVYVAPEERINATIGSIQVAQVMAVIDLNRFEQHFGHPTDGMLGYPFLRNFVVKVDFQKKLLTLFPRDGYIYRGPGVEIALKPSRDFVITPITLGSDRLVRYRVDIAVDTGSDATMMLYDQYVRQLELVDSRQHSVSGLAFGLNGFYPVALGSIDSFYIGDAETHNVAVDYLAENQTAAAEQKLPGAIGNGILQNFRAVIFDVPQGRMFLELKPPPLTPGTTRTVRY
ncbi:MAG: aspartyl protease family protein [Acidobacteriaceae bacterium]